MKNFVLAVFFAVIVLTLGICAKMIIRENESIFTEIAGERNRESFTKIESSKTLSWEENSWNINYYNIVISAKLSKIEDTKSTYHEHKTFHIVISKNGSLVRLDEMNFNILDTDPKTLVASPNYDSKYGIKKFHFDQDLGILEIDFNEKNESMMVNTAPKLIITRSSPIDDKGPCIERYSCNAIFEYYSRLNPEYIESTGWSEWQKQYLKKWTENKFKSVNEIILPSARIAL